MTAPLRRRRPLFRRRRTPLPLFRYCCSWFSPLVQPQSFIAASLSRCCIAKSILHYCFTNYYHRVGKMWMKQFRSLRLKGLKFWVLFAMSQMLNREKFWLTKP